MTRILATFFLICVYTTSPQTLLNLHFKCPDPGGIESHLLGFNQIFTQHNIKNVILTSKHSTFLIDALHKPTQINGQSYRTFDHASFDPKKDDLEGICGKDNIGIIIGNWLGHLSPSIEATKGLPVKIIYMHHNFDASFDEKEIEKLNHVSGIIAVSPKLTDRFKELQKTKSLTVKNIVHIAPFWNEDKFIDFKPTQSKKTFFKEVFNLELIDGNPIISSVANLYWYKNHKVLLKALGLLHKNYQTKFHLVLAGDGPDRTNLEILTKELNLESCVHFIGKTLEVPELLYHSDLHVLPSSHESFGLVHLEAAMMKKPFIGATGTGAEGFIQQGITGFIFQNDNAQDLADKLKTLLDNQALRIAMGKRAFAFTRQHYANKVLFNKWIEFLDNIK